MRTPRDCSGPAAQALGALNDGYQLAFLVGALMTAAAALLGAVLLRPRRC